MGNGCGIGVRMWDMELGLWDRDWDYGVELDGGVWDWGCGVWRRGSECSPGAGKEPCAAITHLPVGLGNGCEIGVRMWGMELGLWDWDGDYGVGLEGGV